MVMIMERWVIITNNHYGESISEYTFTELANCLFLENLNKFFSYLKKYSKKFQYFSSWVYDTYPREIVPF
jgi:hypothetical protein